jgi:hypothetical protein
MRRKLLNTCQKKTKLPADIRIRPSWIHITDVTFEPTCSLNVFKIRQKSWWDRQAGRLKVSLIFSTFRSLKKITCSLGWSLTLTYLLKCNKNIRQTLTKNVNLVMLFSCCMGHCPYVERSFVKTHRVEFLVLSVKLAT